MKLRTTMLTLAGLCGLAVLNMGGGCQSVLDEQAEQALYDALGNATITVYPVFVRDGEVKRYDAAAAGTIGAFLNDDHLATYAAGNAEIPINSVWGSNQAKMFRDSIVDFQNYLARNPLSTEYALLAEYLIGGKGVPLGVHIYLLDAAGRPAYVCLLNSHHPEFNNVKPQTVADCTTIVVNTLRHDLEEGRAQRQTEKNKLRTDSSITVFPMRLVDKTSKDVGDVLGLTLEKYADMTEVYMADSTYERASGANFEDVARGFGEFVVNNPIKTDFALYAEVDGVRNPPQVLEVRAVLVNKAGNVVWTDRQTPEDPDFKRLRVNEPMLCCMLVGERLKTQIDHGASVAKPKGEGRMARLWREKSGTPDEETRKEIRRRADLFKRNHGASTVLVYPVKVNEEVDRDSAAHLVALLGKAKFCQAEAATAAPRFEIAPNSNEQKRLWDLAKAFREYVQGEKPDADYMLLAEYSLNPSDQKVWTVHTVVCDRAGDWVIVDFQNDHQPDFKRIDPRSTDDSGALVLERLKSYAR